jgi:ABC-2 type transport system permease protein
VAPRAAVDLSRRLHPTPTAFAFAKAMATDLAGADAHSGATERVKQLEIATMKRYGVSRLEDLPVSFAGIRLQDGEDHGNHVFDQRYGQLWASFEQQNRVRGWFALVAPLLAVRPVSMGMSGTDSAQHRHFATAAEEYRRDLNRRMNDELRDHAKGKDYGHILGNDYWQQMPPFEYTAPGADWVLRQQKVPLLLLGGWLFLSFAVCYRATTKLKVD